MANRVVLVPDVGEALAAAGLLHTLLEGVELSPGIYLGGRGSLQHRAQVQEVLLVGGAFRERGPRPLLRERLWGQHCPAPLDGPLRVDAPDEAGEFLIEAFRVFEERGVSYAFVPGGFGGRANL